jgi:hypothetical protein
MHKIVFTLLFIGIVLCLAGHRHQKQQRANEITWQDVNVALQSVETAKLELFQSLNEKAVRQ